MSALAPTPHTRFHRGQAVIFISLSLVPMLGILGLIVDIGWAYWRREAARTAAQSAAVAAAMIASRAANFNCGSGVSCAAPDTACPVNPSPATSAFMAGCLYARQNGFTATGRQNVVYQANTSSPPVAGITPAYWVSYTVSETIPTLFSAVLGQNWMQIKSRGTAAVFAQPTGACIYALDPAASGAVATVGTADVYASCGVYDNSNASDALTAKGNSVIDATPAKITLSGGYDLNGHPTVTPAPLTYQPPTADPFASVPAPTVPSGRCDSTGITGGTVSMPADHICVVCGGGISASGNPNITLSPGLYILKGGSIDLHNGSLTGTGVTIYMTAGFFRVHHQRQYDHHALRAHLGAVSWHRFLPGPHDYRRIAQDRRRLQSYAERQRLYAHRRRHLHRWQRHRLQLHRTGRQYHLVQGQQLFCGGCERRPHRDQRAPSGVCGLKTARSREPF